MCEQNTECLIANAAELMNTTELNVLMHIKRGLLEGEERDGVWYVSKPSLESLLARERKANGAVCASVRHCGKGCSSS
ncbi:MAG: hypothetical protein C0622_12840 [Desulfuromonas sp.]|nr:MAG: hypothetical protein C0622_12840 [Desulfuromonas sp.]